MGIQWITCIQSGYCREITLDSNNTARVLKPNEWNNTHGVLFCPFLWHTARVVPPVRLAHCACCSTRSFDTLHVLFHLFYVPRPLVQARKLKLFVSFSIYHSTVGCCQYKLPFPCRDWFTGFCVECMPLCSHSWKHRSKPQAWILVNQWS